MLVVEAALAVDEIATYLQTNGRSVRNFVAGYVRCLRDAGYSDLDPNWGGSLGWGGSCFTMYHSERGLAVGYTSDSPVPSLSDRRMMLLAASQIADTVGEYFDR